MQFARLFARFLQHSNFYRSAYPVCKVVHQSSHTNNILHWLYWQKIVRSLTFRSLEHSEQSHDSKTCSCDSWSVQWTWSRVPMGVVGWQLNVPTILYKRRKFFSLICKQANKNYNSYPIAKHGITIFRKRFRSQPYVHYRELVFYFCIQDVSHVHQECLRTFFKHLLRKERSEFWLFPLDFLLNFSP